MNGNSSDMYCIRKPSTAKFHLVGSIRNLMFVPVPTNIAQIRGVIIISSLDGQIASPIMALSCTKSRTAAFTLIEILVTLCVLSILLTVALPSFRTMLLNSRIASTSNALANDLNYARSTALSTGTNIQVCPLGALNSTTCGTSWSNGWIVITQPASGTAVLLKTQGTTSTDPVITSSVTAVNFDTHGLATTQANFTLCDSRGATYARSVGVQATGYVQSGSTPGQAVWNNAALTCP